MTSSRYMLGKLLMLSLTIVASLFQAQQALALDIEVEVTWQRCNERVNGALLPKEELGGYEIYWNVLDQNGMAEAGPTDFKKVLSITLPKNATKVNISAACYDKFGLSSDISDPIELTFERPKPPNITGFRVIKAGAP